MEGLELLDVGIFSVWEPDRRGIGNYGFDKGIVGKEKVFFLVTPGGTSKAFKDTKTGSNSRGDGLDMGCEGEVCIKGDTKDFGGFIKGEKGVVYENFWVESGLVVIRGEKGNRGLLRGNGEVIRICPVRIRREMRV